MKKFFIYRFLFVMVMVFAMVGTAAGQFDLLSGEENGDDPSALDLLKARDENLVVLQNDGAVTWLAGDLTDTIVVDADSAWSALEELSPVIGADENTEFKPDVVLADDSGYTYYTYIQFFNNISIIDSVVKLIVDSNGHVAAVAANITPIDPDEYNFEEVIDEGTALQIVMDQVKNDDPAHEYVFTEDMDAAFLSLPVDGIDESPAGVSSKAFYIFYSNNPNASNDKHDMPMLAHYVTMNGFYAGSQPCAYVGDKIAMEAADSDSVFADKTASTWTGTVTDHNGNQREITVPVMTDADGVTWLGDLDRKIVVAECADMIQDVPVAEAMLNSNRNESWPNKVLMAYENYIKAWDFYDKLGWTGPDGSGTPMVILNNYVDSDLNPVDNAVYMGFNDGFHIFATSEMNDYCESLDVIGHEFTHAVTSAAMTVNLYINEYGAINEAMSDIMGNIIEHMVNSVNDPEWLVAETSGAAIRSMSDPNKFQQPGFVGDQYWVPKTGGYNESMDYGGVHTNSSLLNSVAYKLSHEGMTNEELCHLFSGVICGLIPTTGNAEMGELLLFSAKISGLEKYSDLIQKVCAEVGFGINASTLVRVPEGFGRLVMYVPQTEKLDRNKTMLMSMNMAEVMQSLLSLMMSGDQDLSDLGDSPDNQAAIMLAATMMQSARMIWADYETGLIVTVLPEGDYTLTFMQDADSEESASASWNGNRWVASDDAEGGSGFVHIQDGCETWISSDGLDDIFDVLPVEDEDSL